MNRVSLKMKLTLLYTLLMTAVVCGILVLLFSLGNRQILSSVQSRLRESVYGASGEIDWDDGYLEFDGDLDELENGVYLSVYDMDGSYLYGQVPSGFPQDTPLQDGSLRTVRQNGQEYGVLDLYVSVRDYGYVYIRGVASVSAAEEGVYVIQNTALILLPLLVIVTGVLGYFMTRRTLMPVSRMTATVRQIRQEKDLSKRIGLGKGSDEIYRLGQTFDALLAEIEEGFKREQQFTSDVSHELRTPVAAMMLQCETLLQDDSLSAQAKEGVDFLYQKVRYLSSMISQLLLLSRADQGRQPVVMEPLDFSELLEMSAMEAEEMAAEKAIKVSTGISSGLYVKGDETLLIRMVMNLVENAVNYGREGGHLGISLDSDGTWIRGSISDDGVGISQKDLPHIWERFYQADSSRSKSTSSGLGLSMVAWIIQAHGGHIQAESVPGRGSTFTFFLPEYHSDTRTC
ncbi:MAG TPA: HAMP domain-containing protein [Candidatus Scybalocola faecavium]|nr:HAMP domain-containing protein [Candidatus Scybalocola faecavium]